MPLRMIVPVDTSSTKSKTIGPKKNKASKMVSPSKIKPFDLFVDDKSEGIYHRDMTEITYGESDDPINMHR